MKFVKKAMEGIFKFGKPADHVLFLNDCIKVFYSHPIRYLPVYFAAVVVIYVVNLSNLQFLSKGLFALLLLHIIYRGYLFLVLFEDFKRRWKKYVKN